jgi:uncharacterized phage protein (predicted DNA packaging)
MAVDLSTAKQQLNLTTSDDDALVTRLLLAAQDWLERQLGYKISERYPDGVPPALDQAVLVLTAHYYANREATLVGVSAATLPFGLDHIVNDYRDWSWSCE